MGLFSYIRGSDLSEAERLQGISEGTLEAWRVDDSGEVWYKQSRLPLIMGVPKDGTDEIAGDFEQFAADDIDDDCEDIVVRDDNGDICATVPGGVMRIAGGTVRFDLAGGDS